MWFDSHCHLHLCAGERPLDDLLSSARAQGVADIVTVGIDVESSREVAAMAHERALWCSVGVHPNESANLDDDAWSEIVRLTGDERVVAVGESGLDFYRDDAPLGAQRDAFARHIELARARDLALIVHTRSSVSAALDLLAEVSSPARLVFHCWSGDADELARALSLGAYVSFAGNVSFASASDLRERAAEVPRDRLLVETDAPFLTPVPHRGRPNEPAYVADVGAAVAGARGEEPVALADATSANARRLYALDR
jgi:TatD DNase family protein